MALNNFKSIIILIFGLVAIQFAIAGPIQKDVPDIELELLYKNFREIHSETLSILNKISKDFLERIEEINKRREEVIQISYEFLYYLEEFFTTQFGEEEGACVAKEHENVVSANSELTSLVDTCISTSSFELLAVHKSGNDTLDFGEISIENLRNEWALCSDDDVDCKDVALEKGHNDLNQTEQLLLEFKGKVNDFEENGFKELDECVASAYQENHIEAVQAIMNEISQCFNGIDGIMNIFKEQLISIVKH